jgi:hypothetical protein
VHAGRRIGFALRGPWVTWSPALIPTNFSGARAI